MSEWKPNPAETAPHDGTSFLAAIEVSQWNRERNICHTFWEMHVVRIDDETGDIDDDMNQGWGVLDYTHWMPLPNPPHTIPHTAENETASD